MRKRISGAINRALAWVLVPLYFPEYRRLMIRTFVLTLRLELLCTLVAVVSPFATPGLMQLLRRWFEQLRLDVAEFGRSVRAVRGDRLARSVARPELQNPWV